MRVRITEDEMLDVRPGVGALDAYCWGRLWEARQMERLSAREGVE